MSDMWVTAKNKHIAILKLKEKSQKYINKNSPTSYFSTEISSDIDSVFKVHTITNDRYKSSLVCLYNAEKHFSLQNDSLKILKKFENDLVFFNFGQFSLARTTEPSLVSFITWSHKNNFINGVDTHYQVYDIMTMSTTLLAHEFLKKDNLDILKILADVYDNNLPVSFEMNEYIQGTIDIPMYKNKCNSLCAIIEEALKKFDYYVQNGELDLDVFSNVQVKTDINSIPSSKKIKNLYLSNKFWEENLDAKLFINDNEISIMELLAKDIKVSKKISKYEQQLFLNIASRTLFEDSESRQYNLLNEVKLLQLIKNQGSVCFNSLNNELQHAAKKLLKNGYINYDNKLFSKEELNVYSYYMDNKQFSDGLWLRNKYQHGNAIYRDDDQAYSDYLMILRLFILITLKIYNDFE